MKGNKMLPVLALGVAGWAAGMPAAARVKPHVILIMTDQQRWDAMGCTSGGRVITPALDSLAAEGTMFTHAYTSCPSSTPARAGLLTGLSPWHHGMLGYGEVAPRYRYEMPRMLREAGYYTFGIGKMHWHPQRERHGFHATLLDESGRVEDVGFVSDYRQWFRLHAPGLDPDSTGIGWNDHGAGSYVLDERLHPTRWTGGTACELIRNYDAESGQPLFLKVSFARPHSPYDPPARFLQLYAGREIPAPAVGDWCGKYAAPADPARVAPDAPFGNFGEEYARRSRRHYYASVTFVDEEIGKIIRALKEKGMYDRSLIIFVADHGDMLGDHHHWRKTYPYEGSSHIPFLVKWPAGTEGMLPRVDVPVELRDVLPTMLAAAGADVPADMDGRPLQGPARGETGNWRRYIDLEHAACYDADNYWCALTDGDIKYIWNFHNGTEQLFDLKKDPMELHNVAADGKYVSVLQEMRRAMADHLSERGEGFVRDGRPVVRRSVMLYGPDYPR